LVIAALLIAIAGGLLAGVSLTLGVVIALFAVFLFLMLLMAYGKLWAIPLWIAIFGLAIWSYGFNNVPLVRPVPLVDVLVLSALIFGFPRWWGLRRFPVVRRLLTFLSLLLIIVFLRLIIDLPKFGLLAVRDALFAFELWAIFPAIALGYTLGEQGLNRNLFWLFCVAMAWFLLYPWRDWVVSISPVVGIQRPVPLFAFTTAGILSVPMIFWFLWYSKSAVSFVGAFAALLILLMAQSRGTYLALLGSFFAILLLRPESGRKLGQFLLIFIFAGILLSITGQQFSGRLGLPVNLDSVAMQLSTLAGKEGAGAGSLRHRLQAWPAVVEQVLSTPVAPFFGVGLGPDLFQGFALGGDILVRKPHNDFLEIWARLGVVGLFPWIGFLVILGWESIEGLRRDLRHAWIVALQIVFWIKSASQPTMGFAYTTVLWASLTGLWIGAQLRKKVYRV